MSCFAKKTNCPILLISKLIFTTATLVGLHRFFGISSLSDGQNSKLSSQSFTKSKIILRQQVRIRLNSQLTNLVYVQYLVPQWNDGSKLLEWPGALLPGLLLYSCMQSRGWKQKLCPACRYNSVRLQDHRVTPSDSLDSFFFFFCFFAGCWNLRAKHKFIPDSRWWAWGASRSCDWPPSHYRCSVSIHHLGNICTRVSCGERERECKEDIWAVGLHMLIRLLYFIFCIGNFSSLKSNKYSSNWVWLLAIYLFQVNEIFSLVI